MTDKPTVHSLIICIYFAVNLSQVGNSNNNEDSSSEETSPVGGKSGVRPRSTSIDRSHGGYVHSVFLVSWPQ